MQKTKKPQKNPANLPELIEKQLKVQTFDQFLAKTGRPRKYKSPKQMQKAIDAYFKFCEENNEPLMITELALALGFSTRQGLLTYEGYSKEFYDTIKRAKLKIEAAYERRLLYSDNPGGSIFALKNFDWIDKKAVEQSGTLNIKPILGGVTNDIPTDDSNKEAINTEETN